MQFFAGNGARYNITTYSLELPSFSVSVRCRGHSDGSPQAVPCKKDALPGLAKLLSFFVFCFLTLQSLGFLQFPIYAS